MREFAQLLKEAGSSEVSMPLLRRDLDNLLRILQRILDLAQLLVRGSARIKDLINLSMGSLNGLRKSSVKSWAWLWDDAPW